MTDSQFVKSFIQMIVFLVVLAVVLIFAGAMVGGAMDDKLQAQTDQFTQEVIAKRTQPVGSLNVGEIVSKSSLPGDQSSDESVQVADAASQGESVYNSVCHICHNAGITGAPKPGDTANWAPRLEKGLDTLYANSINGYQGETGIMPPKGGNLAISDEDVKAAVDYMVSLVQ